MQPVKVLVLAQPGADWMDWERRLFAAIDAAPDLTLVGWRPAVPSAPAPPLPAPWRTALALEARLLRPTRAPDAAFAPPRAAEGAVADVVLCHLRGDWPDTPPDGDVWGYDALLSSPPEGAGLTAVHRRRPVTRLTLLHHDAQGDRPLAVSDTNTKICGSFNTAYALDKLGAVVLRTLRRRGDLPTAPPLPRREPPPTLRHLPGYGVAVAGAVARRAGDTALRRVGGRPEEWTLLVGRGDPLSLDPATLRELPQPPTESRADPFLFVHDGTTWVFYEAFSHSDGRGRLEVGRLAGDWLSDTRPVDLGAGHLSFPFVFRDGDAIFMIPETCGRDRLEVWRCTAFPDTWVLHATALEGHAPADSTLIRHAGDWWLFTNLSHGAFTDQGMALHLFRTDGPGLSWLSPHPGNPVVLGTATARNAGRPFHRGGVLYRPAQEASHGKYGHALHLMRLEALTPAAYRETRVRSLTPDLARGTTGCHHMDSDGTHVIVDARRAYGQRLLGRRDISLVSDELSLDPQP